MFHKMPLAKEDFMFKRKVSFALQEWKEKWAGQYAVLLEGARRVGKSTIAEHFAKENYRSYILIDFSKLTPALETILEDINELDLFFLELQNHFKVKLYHRESLIIFDEVQLYPKARQAIKHLVADGRYDYIETGSLISIKKNVQNILIPSEEMKIPVYPMDYEEFCWATGENYDLLREAVAMNKPLRATNNVLMRRFRLYMAVGGMPQAVAAYVDGKNFQEIDVIKKRIIELYKDDFRKIDPSGRMAAIYESIPSQFSLNRHKFSLGKAIKKKKTDKDASLLYDLIDSKTVLLSSCVRSPEIPLNLTEEGDCYKLYLSDIGLLTSLLVDEKKDGVENIYAKLLGDKLSANLGFLYENVAASMIVASGRELHYFTWRDEGDKKMLEIDFLLSDGKKVVPIEIKSSDVKNHQSINRFSKKYSRFISRRILFSQNDFGNDDMLELKPMYALPCVLDDLGSNKKK